MTESKGWDWKIVNGTQAEFWRRPSEESFYLINRWGNLRLNDFLDLGCGLGRHAVLFGKNGFNVTCFDISNEAVRQTETWAEADGLILKYEVGDAIDLPFANESFDSILSYHVINHTDTAGMRKIADEIYRVLRPGGECYLTLGSKDTWAWKEKDWPMVDENTKLRQEDGPENNVPHFYADYALVKDLFSKFEILDIHQVEEFKENQDNGKVYESWHYHVLIRKTN